MILYCHLKKGGYIVAEEKDKKEEKREEKIQEFEEEKKEPVKKQIPSTAIPDIPPKKKK